MLPVYQCRRHLICGLPRCLIGKHWAAAYQVDIKFVGVVSTVHKVCKAVFIPRSLLGVIV